MQLLSFIFTVRKQTFLLLGLFVFVCDATAVVEEFSAKSLKTIKTDDRLYGVKFSPLGNYFAYRVRDIVYLTDKNYSLIEIFNEKATSTSTPNSRYSEVLDFSPDEKYLAFGYYQAREEIAVVNLTDSKTQNLKGHSGEIGSVSFSPDGNYLASGSADKTIKIWKLSNGKFSEWQTLQGHFGPVLSISFSSDGKYMASGSEKKNIKIWKLSNEKFFELQTLGGHSFWVTSVSFSPDGKYLASGSSDLTIQIWQYTDGQFSKFQTLKGHPYGVTKVSFSPNGNYLASANNGGSIKIWQLSDGKFFELQHSISGLSVSFSPDGKYFASTRNYKTIKIWQLTGVAGKNPPTVKTIQPEPKTELNIQGKYYALVIGINQYQYMRSFNTIDKDVQVLSALLRDSYGFEVTTLFNKQATRQGILNEINDLQRKLQPEDKLLIYYAGHGHEENQMSAWLPVDAKRDEKETWIDLEELIPRMTRSKLKHLLLLNNSTALAGSASPAMSNRLDNLQDQSKISTYFYITSNREPITDRQSNRHSFFTNMLINALSRMDKEVFSAQDLYETEIEEFRPIPGQSIEFGIFFPVNQQYGDFIFRKTTAKSK